MPPRLFGAFLVALALFISACADDAPATQPAPSRTIVASPTLQPSPAASPVIGGAPRACAPPYPSGPPTPSNVFCADPSIMQQASVVRIVDGDTLRAIVDGVEEPVRLFGVDTPERGDECYGEAADVLRMMVALHRGQILLVPDARDRDSYDRLLRYVYTPDGLSIDALLIAEGYGYAWTRDGALRDALVQVEAVARLEGRGCLWR